MKNKADYAQIIEFCQIMLIISKSEGRTSGSLSALLTKDNENKASQWAVTISRNLEQGNSIEESCQILENVDPVLNRLLPLILKKQLYYLLESYIRFLTFLELLKEDTKNALFYPFILACLLFLSLLQLNYVLFPEMAKIVQDFGANSPFLMNILFFADKAYWPLSLLIPLVILLFLFLTTMSVINGGIYANSFIAKITGIQKALRLQEISRIQNLIGLYLSSGETLENTIQTVAELCTQQNKSYLLFVAKKLAEGISHEILFEDSEIFDIMLGNEGDNDLSSRFKIASENNYKSSKFLIKAYSGVMTMFSLLAASLLVALIVCATFDSYYWLMWSI
ncbi:MAG: hypothetical protein PHF29_00540 [Candidatus Riflebacteria bacterium]|nr:hypothetical protein [Candidatus Riflebacteria bacterium]